MPTALQMASDDVALKAAVTRSRKLLNKRAMVAAAAVTGRLTDLRLLPPLVP